MFIGSLYGGQELMLLLMMLLLLYYGMVIVGILYIEFVFSMMCIGGILYGVLYVVQYDCVVLGGLLVDEKVFVAVFGVWFVCVVVVFVSVWFVEVV